MTETTTLADEGAGDEPDIPLADRRIFERRIRALVTPDLVAEHRACPFGPHSAPLLELMHFLRRNVARNRPRYVGLREHDPPGFRIAVMRHGARGFAPVEDTIYAERGQLEHAVFLRRLSDLGLR